MRSVTAWIFVTGLLAFGWRRILAYLRYYQQEEYNRQRFLTWICERRAFDRRGTCIAVVACVATLLLTGTYVQLLVSLLAAVLFGVVVYKLEGDPRNSGKVRLQMTERASKIAYVAFAIFAAVAVIPVLASCPSCESGWTPLTKSALCGIVVVQLPPLLLLIANAILWPAEKARQQFFISDAKRILQEVNPFVIGITGSYGKTGAKAALGELLTQTLAPTFFPKKSINTVLGITRAIRETMLPVHRYAVIEMGAYNIGSIKRLCEFTPPKAALVTAVGIMHLERFGSPENVYVAKSEIAQALPADGILVCNGDSPNARRMATEHSRATTLLYGLDSSAGRLDCLATDISFGLDGTRFVIEWKGARYPGRTPLLGRPAISNILGAFTMACALGADPSYATACLANLEPVDNRLVLDKQPGVSYLRDAYNSNPIGFAAALEVLAALPYKRRILMTPGMIELGDQQYNQNKSVAAMAATVCDLIIVVGHTNRAALNAGLQDAQYAPDKTVLVDTREEAFSVVSARCGAGDIVLIENDLGDLHEGRIQF